MPCVATQNCPNRHRDGSRADKLARQAVANLPVDLQQFVRSFAADFPGTLCAKSLWVCSEPPSRTILRAAAMYAAIVMNLSLSGDLSMSSAIPAAITFLSMLAVNIGMTVSSVAQSALPSALQSGAQLSRRPRPRPAAVEFSFTVSDGSVPSSPPVLLAGQTVERLGGHSSFERRVPGGNNSVDCSFDSQSLFDGTILLQVHWREWLSNGEQIRWDPTVRLRRGADSTASMTWAGGQHRVLRVRGQ